MQSHQKRWLLGGGAVLLIGVLAFVLFGGGDPMDDLSSMSVEKRLKAIELLEQRDTAEAAAAIAPYTTDEDIQVARRSLFAIGRMRNGASSETLVHAMKHPRVEIREAAVSAMALRGDKVDRAALRDRLARDTSPQVRVAAAAELGAMRDWDSMPLLVAALDDRDPTVVNTAMRCILSIGGRDHAGFRPNATPAMRAEAIKALKRDWQSFKAINEEYTRYRKIMGQ